MKYTLSVIVENHSGVLSKISGLFSRRSFNIDSLAVGVTSNPAISRITIVANGDEYVVEQLEKQLNKLIPVIKVKRLVEGEYVSRELLLIKVGCNSQKRDEIMRIAELMSAKVADVANSSITLEFSGSQERIDTLVDLLKPYGLKEIVRTGTVAIEKGQGEAYHSGYNDRNKKADK
ncbi:MAG: acetolactate synthase small subunit [Oscillospiraceae bacterium]|nr:acetolactate synthase small subunit [Oscillospiraceae bacterium]